MRPRLNEETIEEKLTQNAVSATASLVGMSHMFEDVSREVFLRLESWEGRSARVI